MIFGGVDFIPGAAWYRDVSWALLGLRVVVGLTLAAHGYNKFFGGGRIPGTGRWFDSIGMKPGKVHALVAASTEVGSGVLLALGLVTPLAAAGFVGLMLVAAWTVNRPNGFFTMNHGWEFNLTLAVVAVAIATVSPGRYSLDQAINLETSFKPGIAFAIAAGVGLVGGILQLLVFWRPPKPEPATPEAGGA